jgi:hypothetical protein
MVTTASRMFQRRRTAAQWTSENPVLGAGEIGIESDTLAVKVGNGATAWTSLAYLGLSAQAQATLLGRAAGAGTGTPTALTATQAKAALALTAADSANTPAGSIAATTVQAAINELDQTITDLPELAVADPSEIDADTAGGVTTLALLDTIARMPLHAAGQYYANYTHGLSGTQTMTQDRLILQRVILSKGTIDRIGIEVLTAVASLICRLGIYTDDGGLPLTLIAEATSTADCSTTGVKDLTISAVIPKNGPYWLASVTQAAAGGGLRAPSAASPQFIPQPLGTAAPSGANSYLARRQDSVTGAIPASITALVSISVGVSHLIHYRYSTVG